MKGAQWLSVRVLDSRPKSRGFEPHRRHCVVSLSKNINPSLVLVQPRKIRPFITERLLMGRKESNQTNSNKSTYNSRYPKSTTIRRKPFRRYDNSSLTTFGRCDVPSSTTFARKKIVRYDIRSKSSSQFFDHLFRHFGRSIVWYGDGAFSCCSSTFYQLYMQHRLIYSLLFTSLSNQRIDVIIEATIKGFLTFFLLS